MSRLPANKPFIASDRYSRNKAYAIYQVKLRPANGRKLWADHVGGFIPQLQIATISAVKFSSHCSHWPVESCCCVSRVSPDTYIYARNGLWIHTWSGFEYFVLISPWEKAD